jgi:hypothetical protein
MEILLADFVLLGGAFVAFRWALRRPIRFAPLIVAILGAWAFTLVRNAKNLEESAFLIALGLACAGACAVTAVATLGARAGARRSFHYGAFAGALMPLLFVAGIMLRYTACLISGCDLE